MYKYISLFTLYFVVLFNPGVTKADDWPTFMHDNHRSGVTSEQLELPLSESWVFESAHRPQPAWPLLAKQDYSVSVLVVAGAVFYTVVSSIASAGLFRWSHSAIPGYANNVIFGVLSAFR